MARCYSNTISAVLESSKTTFSAPRAKRILPHILFHRCQTKCNKAHMMKIWCYICALVFGLGLDNIKLNLHMMPCQHDVVLTLKIQGTFSFHCNIHHIQLINVSLSSPRSLCEWSTIRELVSMVPVTGAKAIAFALL